MRFLNNKKSIISIIFVLVMTSVIPVTSLKAQTNESELIITWQAQNFYPSNYKGKALVVEGSPVLLSASVIENNQIVDLSNAEFSWYVDGDLYRTAVGASEIVLDADKNSGESYFIRVLARSDNGNFEKAFNLSVGESEVVIENNSPSNAVPSNGEVLLKSTPYFFNVSSVDSLTFWWEINGVLQDGRDRLISIEPDDIQRRQSLIRSIISNNQSPTESARTTIQLIKQ